MVFQTLAECLARAFKAFAEGCGWNAEGLGGGIAIVGTEVVFADRLGEEVGKFAAAIGETAEQFRFAFGTGPTVHGFFKAAQSFFIKRDFPPVHPALVFPFVAGNAAKPGTEVPRDVEFPNGLPSGDKRVLDDFFRTLGWAGEHACIRKQRAVMLKNEA